MSLSFYLSFCMHSLHWIAHLIHHRIVLRVFLLHFSPTSSNTFLSRPTAFNIPPSPHASHFSPASPSSHTPFLPLQHHVAQQCMRHIAHLFKISSSSVSYFYITLPTSPNTFSSYPIALNFPSATSASAAPRPCYRPGFQPLPSTRPTSFPTHTDKGIWKHSSHWFVLPWCFTAFWIIQLMLQQLGLVWFGCSCDSLHEDCWMYVHLSTQTMNMHIPFLNFTKKKKIILCAFKLKIVHILSTFKPKFVHIYVQTSTSFTKINVWLDVMSEMLYFLAVQGVSEAVCQYIIFSIIEGTQKMLWSKFTFCFWDCTKFD